MPSRERTDSERFLPKHLQGQSLSAVRFLIDHLRQTAHITGYMPTKDAKPTELVEEGGIAGHELVLVSPKKGFTDFQRESIETYAQSITFWTSLLVEFDWREEALTIAFRQREVLAEDLAARPARKFSERFRSRSHKVAVDIGRTLTDSGFLVREPIRVNLVMGSRAYGGFAIVVRYPHTSVLDKIGIKKAYDHWVPLVADVFARAANLKSETIRHGETATIFFTANKSYVPSHYVSSLHEASPEIRLVVPKRRSDFDAIFFARPTYRACKALAKQCRRNFVIPRRPMLAWGMKGHTLVLHYKKGAAGKIADDSYVYNVRLVCEKLLKRYGVRASLIHEPGMRSLIVTFYTELDNTVHRHGVPGIMDFAQTPVGAGR